MLIGQAYLLGGGNEMPFHAFYMLRGLTFLPLLSYALVSIAIYLCPTLIATYRNHPSRLQLMLLNILLGWTLIGWAAALIWAVSPPAPVIAAE
jgi:hypothetical protein